MGVRARLLAGGSEGLVSSLDVLLAHQTPHMLPKSIPRGHQRPPEVFHNVPMPPRCVKIPNEFQKWHTLANRDFQILDFAIKTNGFLMISRNELFQFLKLPGLHLHSFGPP